MVTDAAKADHVAIAEYAQTAQPPICYFYSTSDGDALSGAGGNVFSTIQEADYNRAFGIYSTIQGGLPAAANNIYAAAAVMGAAMGLNTGLANSYFTMKFKPLIGVAYEPLTLAQITTIEGDGGNLLLSYANSYTFLEQGVVGNGQFFDEILMLDMLVSAIQFDVMDLLTENPSIPQTDPGETQLIHAVNAAAQQLATIGFIAGGTWTGRPILNLNTGDPLPLGYLAQAAPYSTQLASDRQARKAMPIYLTIIEAGAVHSIVIGVYVQR